MPSEKCDIAPNQEDDSILTEMTIARAIVGERRGEIWNKRIKWEIHPAVCTEQQFAGSQDYPIMSTVQL